MLNEKEQRREAIAESYLDHILIALKAGDRGAPFRTFFDNWHAFRVGTGHLTKGERPIWFNNPCARTHQGALRAMQFVSHQAKLILDGARADPAHYRSLRRDKHGSIRLMVDHAVPLGTIVSMLFDRATDQKFECSREGVLKHLDRFYRLGVITAAEDARLNGEGLRNRMPAGWNRGNVFARYDCVSIVGECGEE